MCHRTCYPTYSSSLVSLLKWKVIIKVVLSINGETFPPSLIVLLIQLTLMVEGISPLLQRAVYTHTHKREKKNEKEKRERNVEWHREMTQYPKEQKNKVNRVRQVLSHIRERWRAERGKAWRLCWQRWIRALEIAFSTFPLIPPVNTHSHTHTHTSISLASHSKHPQKDREGERALYGGRIDCSMFKVRLDFQFSRKPFCRPHMMQVKIICLTLLCTHSEKFVRLWSSIITRRPHVY